MTSQPMMSGAGGVAYQTVPGQSGTQYQTGGQSVVFVQPTVVPLTPNQFITDYRSLSVTITILFGILNPLSIIFGIPACIAAFKSQIAIKEGRYEDARCMSLAAAYLTLTTMIFAFSTFIIIVSIPVGLRFTY